MLISFPVFFFLLESGSPEVRYSLPGMTQWIPKIRPHRSPGAFPGLCDRAHAHSVLTSVSASQHPGSPPTGTYLLWIRGTGVSGFHFAFSCLQYQPVYFRDHLESNAFAFVIVLHWFVRPLMCRWK